MKGIIFLVLCVILNIINPSLALAGKDPISWHLLFPIPSAINLNESEQIVYQFTSNLPYTMPTPFYLSLVVNESSTDEFVLGADLCSGRSLQSHESCLASVFVTPLTVGTKKVQLRMAYGKNVVPLPKIIMQVVGSSH